MKKEVKEYGLYEQVTVFSVSLVFGCIIYFLCILFILPQSLPLPKTSAINWLVLHKHSLTVDYMRFALFVLIIPGSVIVGRYLFLWQKK